MRQLKSTSSDLRQLFEAAFLVRHVAEDVEVCHAADSAESVARYMAESDFDLMPVESSNRIVGYVERSSLGSGPCKAYLRTFEPQDLTRASTSLSEVVLRLRERPQVFVQRQNRVYGIVTRGDLQKAPVRMWLFGLVTLVEMQFLRLVRLRYPNDAWQAKMPASRFQKAQDVFVERRDRNEEIDLADCLQFSDKRDLLLIDGQSCMDLGFNSKRSAERVLKDVEKLRNRLAHAQDLVAGTTWPDVLDLATRLERLLGHCEAVDGSPT